MEKTYLANNLFVCSIKKQSNKKDILNECDIQNVKFDINDKVIVVEFRHNINSENFKLQELVDNMYSIWFWKNFKKEKYNITIDNLDKYGAVIFQNVFTNCKLTKIITSKLDYSHVTVSTIKCVFKYKKVEFPFSLPIEVKTPSLKQKEQAVLILKAQNEMLEEAKQTVIKKNKSNKGIVCDAINNAINENVQTAKNELNMDEKDIKNAKYKKRKK